jgi:hypothetical protein
MNDPYDDEDDEYDDDYYNNDYSDQYDPYKFYFKFDVNQNSPLSEWISKMINDIFKKDYDFDKMIVFPVNSWNLNTGGKDKLQYLGSNYANEPIWKTKYWVADPINSAYKAHLQSHAVHFINQPKYYKGLFDILN